MLPASQKPTFKMIYFFGVQQPRPSVFSRQYHQSAVMTARVKAADHHLNDFNIRAKKMKNLYLSITEYYNSQNCYGIGHILIVKNSATHT